MFELILGGIAATYAHKKFPRQTEAVASGAIKAVAWTLKKTAKLITNYAERKQVIVYDAHSNRK